MKLATKYFISCLVLITLLGGGFYYHDTIIKELKTDYNERFANLHTQLQDQHANIEEVNTLLEEQGAHLESKIASVEERAASLTEELDRVEVESAGKIQGIQQELMDIDIESKGFTTIIQQVMGSIVSIKTDLGFGSGVVVNKEGYVLTNHHVIDGISGLAVVFQNGKSYRGRIAGYDKKADLALLKLGGNDRFKPLFFGDFNSMTTGQKVIALGNPAGLDFTVTEGIISALTRTNNFGISVVQMSVAINPGNSGGPLLDGNGYIVGINTYKLGGYEGLGFAMNPDTAERFVQVQVKKDRELLEAAAAVAED